GIRDFHVTGVQTCALPISDNGFGVIGVAPQVRIWCVKVLDRYGFGLDENVIAGVDWVINKKRSIGGDWIMNLSLGASSNSPVEEIGRASCRERGEISVGGG